jgi:hypothetical protein
MRASSKTGIKLKSLILAQIERWRNALHMQVERQHGSLLLVASGERVSNTSERIHVMGDNAAKAVLIPHTPYGGKQGIVKTLRYWSGRRLIS